MLRKCRKHGHTLCVACVLQTIAFPVEHLVWMKLPLFRSVFTLLGV